MSNETVKQLRSDAWFCGARFAALQGDVEDAKNRAVASIRALIGSSAKVVKGSVSVTFVIWDQLRKDFRVGVKELLIADESQPAYTDITSESGWTFITDSWADIRKGIEKDPDNPIVFANQVGTIHEKNKVALAAEIAKALPRLEAAILADPKKAIADHVEDLSRDQVKKVTGTKKRNAVRKIWQGCEAALLKVERETRAPNVKLIADWAKDIERSTNAQLVAIVKQHKIKAVDK
jgi:hypothetical protein